MPERKAQDTRKNDEREQVREQKKPSGSIDRRQAPELESLAALSKTLSSGERVMAPPEETKRAAGALGNQNVLQLIAEGKERQTELAQERTNAEVHNLAFALGGMSSE